MEVTQRSLSKVTRQRHDTLAPPPVPDAINDSAVTVDFHEHVWHGDDVESGVFLVGEEQVRRPDLARCLA